MGMLNPYTHCLLGGEGGVLAGDWCVGSSSVKNNSLHLQQKRKLKPGQLHNEKGTLPIVRYNLRSHREFILIQNWKMLLNLLKFLLEDYLLQSVSFPYVFFSSPTPSNLKGLFFVYLFHIFIKNKGCNQTIKTKVCER